MGASYLKVAPVGDARVDVAMRTFGSAFADTDGNFQRTDNESKDEFALAVAVTKPVAGAPSKTEAGTDEDKAKPANEMRAFVLADADAMSDLLLPRVPGNPLLAFDAVRWLVGEESLAGEIESEEDVKVDQSKQMNMAWFYSTVFGVPLVVLGVGVAVSRRGRRRPQAKVTVATSDKGASAGESP